MSVCITKERTPPSNKKKKTRTNNDHRRANSANQSKNEIGRTPWEEGFNVQGSVEGPISPVNYAGTQINIWGTPGGNWTDELMHIADPSRNPNYGYMTEQMLEVSFVEKAIYISLCFYYDFTFSVYNHREIYQLLHHSHLE